MGQITSNLRYALEISLIRLNVGGTIYDPSLILHIFSQLSIPPFHLDMVQHQSTKLTDFHDARLPTAFHHRSNFIESNLKFPFLDYLSNGISVRALNDFLQEIASAVAANEVRSSTSEGDMLSRLEATYFSPLHTLLRSNRSDASEAAGFTVRYFENMSHRASAGGGDESVCQGRGRDVKADLMSIEIKPEVIVSDRQIRYLVYLVRQGVVVGNPNTGSVDVPDWDGENEHGASYENHENVKRVLKQIYKVFHRRSTTQAQTGNRFLLLTNQTLSLLFKLEYHAPDSEIVVSNPIPYNGVCDRTDPCGGLMGLLLALCVLDRQDYWVDLPAVPGRRLRHRAGRGGGRGDENREGDGEGAEGAGRGGGQGDIGLGGGRPPPRRRGQRGQRGRVRGRGRGRAGREQRGPGRGVGVERDLERPYGPPSARRPPALKLDRQEVKAPSKRHLAQETASVRPPYQISDIPHSEDEISWLKYEGSTGPDSVQVDPDEVDEDDMVSSIELGSTSSTSSPAGSSLHPYELGPDELRLTLSAEFETYAHLPKYRGYLSSPTLRDLPFLYGPIPPSTLKIWYSHRRLLPALTQDRTYPAPPPLPVSPSFTAFLLRRLPQGAIANAFVVSLGLGEGTRAVFKLTAVNQSVTGDGGEVGIAVLTEWIAYERLKEVQAVVVPRAMGAYGGLTRDERTVWGTVLELVGDERKMEDWSERQRYTILSHYDVLHRLGVLHNDVESRHIREAALDGEENAVRIIDFSNARFKDDYDEKTWRKLCKSEMSAVEAMIRLGRWGDEGRIG